MATLVSALKRRKMTGGICIEVWRFDSQNPILEPDRCNTTADCTDSQVCVETEEDPDNHSPYFDCTIFDYDDDSFAYSTKFCMDLCFNPGKSDDTNPIRCPAIDGENCPPGEYLMKNCTGPDGELVDQKICTDDIEGFQEQELDAVIRPFLVARSGYRFFLPWLRQFH